MTGQDSRPLDQAAELARQETVDPRTWDRTASGVMARIRSSVRPGRPLRVSLPDDRGSATHVSERVAVRLLGEALSEDGDLAPSALRLEVQGDRLTVLRVEIVGRYGVDLQVLGERARSAVRAALAGLPLADADAVDVLVSVVDVTLEDPRR